MKKDHVLEQGFTLIEIIIVLVLLGILAATAVPKYFDLQKTAETRAAQSAIAELQARVNMTFAESLMKGEGCTKALDTATTLATTGASDAIAGWTFTMGVKSGTDTTTTTKIESVKIESVTRTASKTTTTKDDLAEVKMTDPEILLPKCSN